MTHNNSTRKGKTPEPGYPGHSGFLPYLLNRVTSLINVDFVAELRRHGLTLTHWRVLALLAEEDGIDVTTLARRTVTDPSTLSRALRQIEKKSLIAFGTSAVDSRYAEIRITARGRNLFLRVLPTALHLRDAAVSGLSRAEIKDLSLTLTRILKNLSAGVFQPPARK